MEFDVLFSGIAIRDLAAVRDWYVAVLGRDPDIVVSDAELMWQITEEGWLYIVENSSRAGSCMTTLAVADIEDALGEIAARGLAVPEPEVVEGAGRKASFTDPDGNLVTFIQVITGDGAA